MGGLSVRYRPLLLWFPPLIDAEADYGVSEDEVPRWREKIPPLHHAIGCVVARWLEGQRLADVLRLDILEARTRGARPPFEMRDDVFYPPDPVAVADPARNISWLLVCLMAAFDGFLPPEGWERYTRVEGEFKWLPPESGDVDIYARRRPRADKLPSVILADCVGLRPRRLAAILRKANVRPRPIRVPTDLARLTSRTTTGYYREHVREALSWVME